MSADEWKVVTKNDKKRVMRKKGGKRRIAASIHQIDDFLENVAVLHEALTCCEEYLCQSDMLRTFLKNWHEYLSCYKIQQLVCFGIGNVSKTTATHLSAPLWQLAFALQLNKTILKVDHDIYFFDPCTTSFEERFLSSLSIKVIKENQRGKRSIAGKSTLFYMPHCPRALYENVLWQNWQDLIIPGQIIIIGNSLRQVQLNQRKLPCIEAISDRLQEEAVACSKADANDAPGNFEGAFNDTYLTWLPKELNCTSLPARPCHDSVAEDSDLEVL